MKAMGELDEYCRGGEVGRSSISRNCSRLCDGEEGMTLRVGTWASTEQSWRAGLGQLGPVSCHHQGEDALHG